MHVLFVMLRVFQVKETDPMLWSRLKNYEVRDALNRKSKIAESRIMICTFGVVVYEGCVKRVTLHFVCVW